MNKYKYIEDLGDDKYKVKCRHADYILEEKDGKVFEYCKKLSQNTSVSMEKLLIMRSMIEPKISDDEFESIKGSDYIRLHAAIAYIYGLDDFLPNEE